MRRNPACHCCQNVRETYGNVSTRNPSSPADSVHQMEFCKRYFATTGFSVFKSGRIPKNQPVVRFCRMAGVACGSASASNGSLARGPFEDFPEKELLSGEFESGCFSALPWKQSGSGGLATRR